MKLKVFLWLSLFCASAVLLACGRSTVITEIPTVEAILPVATSTQAKIFLPGKEIHFEIVETNNGYSQAMEFASNGPELFAVWELTQLTNLKSKVSDKTYDETQKIDLSEYMLIAVFRGRQPLTGFSVQVVKVFEQASSIIVDTNFVEPGNGVFLTTATTAPYQIIKIKKSDLANYPLDVNLHAKTITYGPGTPPPGDDNQTKPPPP